MARANPHHLPGKVWHITHRCHKKEFLLKCARDRKRWIQWLFEAKKRYGLDILDYTVTCNHVHLLVVDGDRDVIPKSLQLVGGKTAQEFMCPVGGSSDTSTHDTPSRSMSLPSIRRIPISLLRGRFPDSSLAWSYF